MDEKVCVQKAGCLGHLLIFFGIWILVSTVGMDLKILWQIDEDVIQEVVRLGFDRTQLIDSLVNRLQNKVMNSFSAMFVLIFY